MMPSGIMKTSPQGGYIQQHGLGLLGNTVRPYDGLNENVLHRLRCLKNWSPIVGAHLSGLGDTAFLEEVDHEDSFDVYKDKYHS